LSVFPPIIRSSMTTVAASGFTFVSWWQLCCFVVGPAGPTTKQHVDHETCRSGWNEFHPDLHVSDSSSVHHQEFFTVHTPMVYVIQVCWQLASKIRMELVPFLSTCFEQFLCPSSGVFHCTHSNGICHTGLLIPSEQDQDGTSFILIYMFRTVPLSIIRSFSLYTQQWYMSYRFADSLRARSGWN